MEQAREMLKSRKGDKSLDDWVYEINQVVSPVDKKDRLKSVTLYSYIRGERNITGKGAKVLAQYFYRQGDYIMVDALSQITLGIPYPKPNNKQN